ncbi:hypothetical protein [Nocardioides sp. R-C-SC26]|uniref:HD domain-containing protein n=1 Tax=Nocardioides sp. R-C-SC26 TaxID=2870414 RepID=UPI001E48609B|nr:hypothetical protein [Nocardioides sp. R-C-SC26]
MEPPSSSWPLASDGPAGALRDELLAAYADPSRGYHDTQHLAEVLERVQALADAGELDASITGAADRAPHGVAARDVVLLAAWFHDAVYDGERDAEERSAAWAEEALTTLVPTDAVTEVARLVRLTETHRPADEDRLGCVLSDADLGILAAPVERYAEYVGAVRSEYAHLDDATFNAGRHAVLDDLLAKPRLFHTRSAYEAWEATARANAGAELARLGRLLAPTTP